VETEQWSGYLGTANRKGRQQRSSIYSHRATSRLYRESPFAAAEGCRWLVTRLIGCGPGKGHDQSSI